MKASHDMARWERVKALLAAALEQPPHERQAFIESRDKLFVPAGGIGMPADLSRAALEPEADTTDAMPDRLNLGADRLTGQQPEQQRHDGATHALPPVQGRGHPKTLAGEAGERYFSPNSTLDP